MASDKYRYFAFEVYPDSASSDWLERLKESHGSYAISPLHSPEDGKPHYHVIYMHGGPCTIDCASRAIPGDIAANAHIEAVHAPRNYQRYLLHLDDPEKQQFEGSPKDLITTLNGFPLDLSRDFSKSELQEQRYQIIDLIEEFDITEYWELLMFLQGRDLDLFDYAASHTVLFNAALTSRREGYKQN